MLVKNRELATQGSGPFRGHKERCVSKVTLFVVYAFLPAAWGQINPSPTPAPTQTTSTSAVEKGPKASVRLVDPGLTYQHIYARVPLIGAGTKTDPKRPMFIAAPSQTPAATSHTGILAYQMQISDDGNWALCEFVGATPQDLAQITQSTDSNVKVFIRNTSTPADVLADFSQYKANFTFNAFTLRVQ